VKKSNLVSRASFPRLPSAMLDFNSLLLGHGNEVGKREVSKICILIAEKVIHSEVRPSEN